MHKYRSIFRLALWYLVLWYLILGTLVFGTLVFDIWYFGIWHLVLWYLVLWYLVFGTLVFGTWYLVLWYLVLGTLVRWYLVLGTLVFGTQAQETQGDPSSRSPQPAHKSWPRHDPKNPAGAPAGLTFGDLGNYAPDRENPYSQELFGELTGLQISLIE